MKEGPEIKTKQNNTKEDRIRCDLKSTKLTELQKKGEKAKR